jgi:hypothetical protein
VPVGFANTTASIYTDGGLLAKRDVYFSSSLYIKGDLTVYGTQSVSYITSSQLNISTNIITVNTSTPSIRFGGLAVYDSGSTGLTGSLLWDSQNNHWLYSNPSGSSYSGGMLISGPRNTGSLGNEQGTTACMLLAGQGGDHLTSSAIYHDSATTCIPNTLIVNSNIGINCTSPNYRLHVNGCTAVDGNIRMGSGLTSGNSTDPGITVQGYSNAGMYFKNCGVGLGAGSSTKMLFLSNSGSVGIGTEDPVYGNLSIYCVDNTPLSSSLWGTSATSGVTVAVYNGSQCANSVAGLRLITRDSGASIWNIYNVSTGPSVGALAFGNGSGGTGYERLRITDDGITCFACQVCAPVAIFSGCVSIVGLNLTSTYASKIGLYNSSSAANVELGTTTSTNGAIISRLTSYNTSNGNSGNESSTSFMGIVSLETQLQGTNGGNFILKTKGDGGTLDTRLTISSTGVATFTNNVNTGILVGNTVGDGNAEYQFVTGASTNTRSGIAIKDSWNGVNNNNAYIKLFVGTGSGTINALSINYLGAACFSNNLTLSSASSVLDVGGVLYVRGNGSAYATHDFNTGVANVALYQQRNAAGTVINQFNAGGCSYFNSGCNVGIGTPTPSNKLQIGTMSFPYSGNEFAIGSGTVDFAIDVTATSVDMYSSAAMSFATTTSERLRIASTGIACFACQVCAPVAIFSGCVGIGSTSPQFKLDIQNGSLGIYHNTNYSGGASGAQLYLGDMNFAGGGYACSAPGIGAVCSPVTGVAGDLAFYTYTGVVACRPERMRIISGGNVGIGTTSPTAQLQICSSDGQLKLSGDGRAQMILGTSVRSWQFETSCGTGNVPGCGIGLVEAGYGTRFQISPGGVACFQNTVCMPMLLASGCIGIGTTSPAKHLEIRTGGSNTTPSQMFFGAIVQAIVGGEPMIAFSSNIAPSTGNTTASELARAGIGFTYISEALPSEFSIGIQCTNVCNSNVRFFNGVERMKITSAGIACFACIPQFPGANLICSYTCTYSSYTAGCWLGLFAGDNGYNGAYAFTVVGQFSLAGTALYSMNYSTVPYIHSSTSLGSTNGNDFYALPHTSAGHADNGTLVCFRRARYSGNTPAGNRTEFCMNATYNTSFTATTYVLAWV